jgi:starch synthase
VLHQNREKLFGIINGIDDTIWNPVVDKEIPYNFSPEDLSNKRMCKIALLKEVGLPSDNPDVPLIGMISRLAAQKGFDILLPIMEKIIESGCRIVVLGTGDKEYEEKLSALAKENPDSIAVVIGFKNMLSHLIEAGADLFLMPSRYEPCGLNQMYSMAYGTIPIVRKTGGLADSVEQADLNRDLGTGFVFENYDSDALLTAVKSAIWSYKDQHAWRKLQVRAMEKDFTWGASADKYIEIYHKAIAAKRA